VQPTIQQARKAQKDTPPNLAKATEREEVASVVWETGVKNIAISCVFVVPVTILKRGSWLVHQFEELSLIFFVHIFSM
jgi:hypothetical protein